MAFPVVVVLAVGLVVFLVVGDQVPQRETVVRGDEVDRGHRPPGGVLVEIGRAGQPRSELVEGGGLAAPVVAHGVAVLAVPFRPLRREAADLVTAGPDVPRLGDELDLTDRRILLDEFEERRQFVDVVELPGQCGSQVETEPVDVHLGHPVPQRIHDELQRMRVTDVEAVAGPGVVHVVALVVVDKAVVGGIVDAPHRQRRTQVVALGGVVVDHVEDDLDAGFVQGAHHRLELLHLPAGVGVGAVLGVGGQETDGVVAPVVGQALVDERRVVGEVVHRHQLDRGDPQRDQVVDDGRMGDRGIGAANLLRDVGVCLGEALDVGLVDDGVGVLVAGRAVHPPVEVRVDDHALGHAGRRVVVVAAVRVAEVVAEQRLVPVERAVDGLGVGVEQQLVGVAAHPGPGVVGAVDAVSVALPGLDVGQKTVPDESVHLGQGDAGFGAVRVEQAQLDQLGGFTEQREVGAGPVIGGAEGVGLAGPRLDSHDVAR